MVYSYRTLSLWPLRRFKKRPIGSDASLTTSELTSQEELSSELAVSGSGTATSVMSEAKDVLTLPAVRNFARKCNVDIALLPPGSGKNGRVEREDIERLLASRKSVVGNWLLPRLLSQQTRDVVVELGWTRYGMWKAMEKARTFIFSFQCCLSSHSGIHRVWKSLIFG
jgi:e3 binding domain